MLQLPVSIARLIYRFRSYHIINNDIILSFRFQTSPPFPPCHPSDPAHALVHVSDTLRSLTLCSGGPRISNSDIHEAAGLRAPCRSMTLTGMTPGNLLSCEWGNSLPRTFLPVVERIQQLPECNVRHWFGTRQIMITDMSPILGTQYGLNILNSLSSLSSFEDNPGSAIDYCI